MQMCEKGGASMDMGKIGHMLVALSLLAATSAKGETLEDSAPHFSAESV
jgi:hypothetical protein